MKNNCSELARINHLLCTDYLQLLATTKNQMAQMLKIIKQFSKDVGMQFSLDNVTLYML